MKEAKELTGIYRNMLLTRFFEETIARLFSMGVMHGTTHLYIGEEAVAAGVCAALAPEDVIASTHRGHGHCIARGMDIGAMMAEMLGRTAGYCKGKGGSMHIADIDCGNIGSNGVVGGGLPLAVGAALAARMQNKDHIVVCFFGDGATNEGAFHESLNLASIWKLPVLFVCEDNQYGLSMSRARSMNVKNITERAASYAMKAASVDGNDAVAVYKAAAQARSYVKAEGPMLLVCETYRIAGHSKSDHNAYRTQQEIDAWKEKDPIPRLAAYLKRSGIMTAAQIAQAEQQARRDVDAALEFAQGCPFPPAEAVLEDVYA